MDLPIAQKKPMKCCICFPMKRGLTVGTILINVVVILVGIFSLASNDLVVIYGAGEITYAKVTGNMTVENFETFKVMQYVIWYGYILLCLTNLAFLARMRMADSLVSRMNLSRALVTTTFFALFNIIMGALEIYNMPPEIGMFLVFGLVAFFAFKYAMEFGDDLDTKVDPPLPMSMKATPLPDGTIITDNS